MVMSGRNATTTSPSLIFCLRDFPVGISASSDLTRIVPRGAGSTRTMPRRVDGDRSVGGCSGSGLASARRVVAGDQIEEDRVDEVNALLRIVGVDQVVLQLLGPVKLVVLDALEPLRLPDRDQL